MQETTCKKCPIDDLNFSIVTEAHLIPPSYNETNSNGYPLDIIVHILKA